MKSTFKTNMVPTAADNEECALSIGEKYLLTIKEAGAYFNIGVKKMRRLAEDNLGVFSVFRLFLFAVSSCFFIEIE